MTASVACARAHSNIALAKYWGKSDEGLNLPAVPSLSMTLGALKTTTRVSFDPALGRDEGLLDGAPFAADALERVRRLLDRVRDRARLALYARVESENDFPTASGLASSASGFAALALAATRAAGLELAPAELSALARTASASAARSIFGGYVALEAECEAAEPVFPAEHWPLVMLVAVTTRARKATGSTQGMRLTARTSPYYPAWLQDAPRLYREARQALAARDFDALGAAMEQSALMMHASMLAARPALLYFSPVTLALVERVRQLRGDGLPAYFTIDAGPHVKVLGTSERAGEIAAELARVRGVEQVITSGPGPAATLVQEASQ